MLVVIIGDTVGSVYEFRKRRSKAFETFFHPNAFYTDDTICAVAVGRCAGERSPAGAGPEGLRSALLGKRRLGLALCDVASLR